MYKFKISKYRNALPKVPKKEAWILDISVGSPQSHGNLIKASAAFLAYNCDARGGGSLGILPLTSTGRIRKDIPLLHCHSEQVSDFDFSPFDDGLLATGSHDCSIKLWRIPEDGLTESLTTPGLTLPIQKRRVENVIFHPTANNGLSSSSGVTLSLWDVSRSTEIWEFCGHTGQVMGVSWKEDGKLVSTLAKDKIVRILDPRSNCCAQETSSHQNSKDGRIVWLGSTDRILTTGFNTSHQREITLRDIRNISVPLKSMSSDTSMGVLMPLYDCDTNMLFIAGKGDSSVLFLEVSDSEPYLTEASRHICELPIKGASLVPKRALDVMQCEVNRLLQLMSNAIIPVTYQVPRKTFRDFHEDLFPETKGFVPAESIEEWMQGVDNSVPKISLNPKTHAQKHLTTFGVTSDHPSNECHTGADVSSTTACFKAEGPSLSQPTNHEAKNLPYTDNMPVPAPRRRRTSSSDTEQFSRSSSVDLSSSAPPIAAPRSSFRKTSRDESISNGNSDGQHNENTSITTKPAFVHAESPLLNHKQLGSGSGKSPKPFQGFRVCKFRHLKVTPMHRSSQIENVRNLSTSVPGECDGFSANRERVAVPLKGPGGKIAIFELNRPGRLPDGLVPVIQNGANVMDFSWDPFDSHRLAVAGDDAKIRLWVLPDGGLTDTVTTPSTVITGHSEKIYFIKFHPHAKDILVSSSFDLTVRIWDLQTLEEKYQLTGHTDHIFGLAWSQNGKLLATVCKDNKIRIYEPRISPDPIKDGNGPVGNRGARILWALDGKFLVVTGFDRVSERQVYVYRVDAPKEPVATVGIDVSPAILIPFYDDDSSTLFLTGKGDSTIYAYEVGSDAPHLHPLSHHKCPTAHQALAFLPKIVCNIAAVEFARAVRLTPTIIEFLSFTVPRIKMEFFQDDLFPPTRLTWEPTLSSSDWLSGKDGVPRLLNLQPEGMEPLTENVVKPVTKSVVPQVASATPVFHHKGKGDLTTLFNMMAIEDGNLPQDSYEGVDSKEWNE